MKHNRNQILLTASCFLASLFLLSACRKDPQEIAALFTDSEAAEIVENSVAERSAGFTMPAVDMSKLITSFLQNCGIPGDTTLTKSKSSGLIIYSYTFNMGWLVNCNNFNVPQDATTTISGNGSLTSPHWNGNDATTGSLKFTGLQPSATAYIANGAYTLKGDLTGSLRKTTPTFNCTTVLTLKDLTILKSDYSISGGTGTVTVTGTAPSGDTKSLSGDLVFNGNGTVTVTINGQSYTFQLQ